MDNKNKNNSKKSINSDKNTDIEDFSITDNIINNDINTSNSNSSIADDDYLEVKNEFISSYVTSFEIGDNKYSMSIKSDKVIVENPNKINIISKPANSFEEKIKRRLKDNLDRFNTLY